jgi:hypothetical protein
MAAFKSQLPSKACAHCGRPFQWRRKWARPLKTAAAGAGGAPAATATGTVWDEVKYCSDACRKGRGPRA